jgi:glycolate oxidase
VLYDATSEGQEERASQLATAIVELCVEVGGSITGEHGVGTDKACSMPKMFGEDDLAVMARARKAFDPDGLCNPGKVLPTPRLCGERPGRYRPHALEEAGVIERT